jgi:hypothetical protein
MTGGRIDPAMIGRCLRALSRHVGDGAISDLADLARLEDELHGNLVDAVARLRAEPWCYSWRAIGRALGISRQAAAQRFAKAGGARRPGGQPWYLR